MPRPVAILLAILLTIGTLAGSAAAPPASRTSAKEGKDRARALADQALALAGEEKWAEAEKLLLDAIALGPAIPADHYNLACCRARLGKSAAAMDSLERAAASGFSDFALIARDQDLDPLRDLPRFRQILARKNAYLRRAAEGTVVALRNRFGDTYHYSIDPDQRLVFATATGGPPLEKLKAELREQAASLHAALFEHKPDAYVTVLMPTAADYAKLVRFRNVPGMYVDVNRTVLAREAGFVLRHEFTHALHAADRRPLGQEHAPWVYEGLGALCETADFGADGADGAEGGGDGDQGEGQRDAGAGRGEGAGGFRPRDNPRFAGIRAAAKRKAIIPLERLLAMKQDEFVRRPNLTYGQSAYLMLYLWEKGLLRKFYDTYKTTCPTDPTGRAALEQVTGQPLAAFQETWRQWLATRKPAAAAPPPGRRVVR